MDRLMRPNMEKPFDTAQAASGGGRSFGAKSARSKSFGFEQKFSAGEFRSKEFSGSKSAWMGNFKFSSKEANTRGKYEVPNAGRQVNTKTMPVVDAREGSKAMPTREFAGQRPYLKRGPSQDRFDREGTTPMDNRPVGWSGTLQPMTIDDVRELLNKNK